MTETLINGNPIPLPDDYLDKTLGTSRAADQGGYSYKTTSLSARMKAGVPKPRLICGGQLYRGALHCIAGPPDSGKTTLVLSWIQQLLMDGEHVLFLDEESGPDIVTEKLSALGASINELDRLVYCPFPGRVWSDKDVTGLLEMVADVKPALVLFDSSAVFLARAGADENTASGVTNWWSRVLSPIAREHGAAVVVVDHDGKSTADTRFARGSSAKLAAVDVMIKVNLVRAFTRAQSGELKLTVSKDRRGYLHRTWSVEVVTGSGVIVFGFSKTDAPNATDTSAWSRDRTAVYEALSPAVPMNYHDLNDSIHKSRGYRMTRVALVAELEALGELGRADRVGERDRDGEWTRM